jgi:4-amino-4-deoxy-L-arabinose transferase-like glycosyltransferase
MKPLRQAIGSAKRPCPSNSNFLLAIFVAGLLLRIAVFAVQMPINNDDHYQHIQYLFNHHRIPLTGEFPQAQHPPLYYLLAAPLVRFHDIKAVQAFSLLCSLLTLSVLFLLIKEMDSWSPAYQRIALLFTCTFPAFIIFGNFISNDTLTFLFGALLFLILNRYLKQPTMKNEVLLGVILGLGLATKMTFLVFIPVVMLCMAHQNHTASIRTRCLKVLVGLGIILALGGYKIAQNTYHYRQPLINCADYHPAWMDEQRVYRGWTTFANVNLWPAIQAPHDFRSVRSSYPLLFYWTHWHPYYSPPLSRCAGLEPRFEGIGRVTYLAAFLPSVLFLCSLLLLIGRTFRRKPLSDPLPIWATWCLLANLAMVFYGGLHYDLWGFFQARYLFPSLAGIIVIFGYGCRAFTHHHAQFGSIVAANLILLSGINLLYLAAGFIIAWPSLYGGVLGRLRMLVGGA